MQTSDQNSADTPAEKVAVHIDACGQANGASLRSSMEKVLAALNIQPVFFDTPDEAESPNPVLILHTAPAEALALALEAGVPAEQALIDWQRRADALLAFFRKNRRRTVIAEDSGFFANPQQALRRMGLAVGDDARMESPDAIPVPDGLTRILGAELLRRDAGATAVAGELEASAALADLDRSPADIQAAHARYVEAVDACARLTGAQTDAMARIAALEKGVAEGRQEQDAVLQQLFDNQSQLHGERQARDRGLEDQNRLAAELTEARSTFADLRAELTEKQQSEEKLREDNRLLEARMHQLRQGLESADAQFKTEQSRRAEAERGRDAAATRLTTIEAERAALLKSRRTLETELEDRFSELGALTGQLVERDANIATRFAELGTLTAALIARDQNLAEQADEIAHLRQRLAEREAKLQRIFASSTYRMTAPLRWLYRLFNRPSMSQ